MMISLFSRFIRSAIVGLAVFTIPLCVVADDDEDEDNSRSCSEKSVKGQYAFYQYGEITTIGAEGAGPAADVGVLIADGRGNFSGSEKLHRADGLVVDIQFCDGVYEVKNNCMGDFTWTAVIGESCDSPIFVIGERTATASIGKDQLYILSTTPGTVLVGIGTKRLFHERLSPPRIWRVKRTASIAKDAFCYTHHILQIQQGFRQIEGSASLADRTRTT